MGDVEGNSETEWRLWLVAVVAGGSGGEREGTIQ
jgi:hypothetical protein